MSMTSLTYSIWRFREFGGWRLVWQYIRLGVLFGILCDAISCFLHGKSAKALYSRIGERIGDVLCRKYGAMAQEDVDKGRQEEGNKEKQKDAQNRAARAKDAAKPKIWTAWLQGYEQAPPLVKACIDSLREYMPEHEVVVINADNLCQYVELSEWLMEKYRRGRIPNALFSDLVRLELLISHGGLWVDSSVLMTDPGLLKNRKWLTDILDAPLFVFQYRHPVTHGYLGISNWCIGAQPEQWALVRLRDMLWAYWREHDCVLDYYIFHRFFDLIVNAHPDVLDLMPLRRSNYSLRLRDRMADNYNAAWWAELTSHVCLHKLNYRKAADAASNVHSYYSTAIMLKSCAAE